MYDEHTLYNYIYIIDKDSSLKISYKIIACTAVAHTVANKAKHYKVHKTSSKELFLDNYFRDTQHYRKPEE